MQTPSNDELRRLTPTINALIAEEADLHGLTAPAPLTPAMVRSVVQVIAKEEARQVAVERKRKVFEILKLRPAEKPDEVPLKESVTPEVAEEPVSDVGAISESAITVPDPPSPVAESAPVDKEEEKPAAGRPWRGLLAAVGTDVEDLRMGTEEKAALMREIIYALQDMAFNEEMPSQNQWNFNKPANLPAALTILNRWEMSSWGELADRAKLKYHGKGPKRRGRRAADVNLSPGKRLPALQGQGV